MSERNAVLKEMQIVRSDQVTAASIPLDLWRRTMRELDRLETEVFSSRADARQLREAERDRDHLREQLEEERQLRQRLEARLKQVDRRSVLRLEKMLSAMMEAVNSYLGGEDLDEEQPQEEQKEQGADVSA